MSGSVIIIPVPIRIGIEPSWNVNWDGEAIISGRSSFESCTDTRTAAVEESCGVPESLATIFKSSWGILSKSSCLITVSTPVSPSTEIN